MGLNIYIQQIEMENGKLYNLCVSMYTCIFYGIWMYVLWGVTNGWQSSGPLSFMTEDIK